MIRALALAALAATPWPTSAPLPQEPTGPPAAVRPQDAPDEEAVVRLLAEFDAAVAAYEARYAAADRDARRALRDERPEPLFWPRFEEHAARGSWRAALWQLDHLRRGGLTAAQRRTFAAPAFARLAREHGTAPHYHHVLRRAPDHARALGDEAFVRLFEDALERNEHAAVQACAHLLLGLELVRRGERARGLALLDVCAERYGDTEDGRRAAQEAFVERNLRVGGVAPDFEARTVDGETFRLSDHRGRVVVLDFFGFW